MSFVLAWWYIYSQVNHLAPFGLIDTHQNMIVLTTYQMAKSIAQLNNELACNGTITTWQHVATQKELILFDQNTRCFISFIGSAVTTTIPKREVF